MFGVTFAGVQINGSVRYIDDKIRGDRTDVEFVPNENGLGMTVRTTRNIKAALSFKAKGPRARIDGIKGGFTQTIYYSERFWIYGSSNKTKVIEKLEPVPAWDGCTEDPVPWYSEPEDYDADDEDPFETYFSDSPWMGATERFKTLGSYKDPKCPEEGETLQYAGGEDSFRLYAAVAIDGAIRLVEGYDWHVKYRCRVDPKAKTGEIADGSGIFLARLGKFNNHSARLGGACSEDLSQVSYGSDSALPDWA